MPGRQTARLGKTIDLSKNGAYFTTEYFMGEGTRLPITIKLPADKGIPSAEVHPDGIVVRCHPEQEDLSVKEYEVAVFFMDLVEEEQELLNGFLERKLGKAQTR
jgi:hypothetical protein